MNGDEFIDYIGLLKQGEMVIPTYLADAIRAMAATGPGTPDLEGFHKMYAPEWDVTDEERRQDELRLLADVYGEENILTDEQVAERQAAQRERWRAKKRIMAWREVPLLRRKWIEHRRVYGPGTDFGVF